jgi:hypothetical protein
VIFLDLKPLKLMSEINYRSDEFTDDFLRTQTDVGDQLLEDQAFQYWPTQEEMNKLALEGQSLLFIDRLKGK